MSHIANVVNALYLEHVSLVRSEVRIGLDSLCYLFELSALFQLYIYHTAVDTLAQGDSHAQCILNTLLRTYAYTVAHRHTRTEVGVAQSLWSQALHQGAYD